MGRLKGCVHAMVDSHHATDTSAHDRFVAVMEGQMGGPHRIQTVVSLRKIVVNEGCTQRRESCDTLLWHGMQETWHTLQSTGMMLYGGMF